MHSAAKLYCFSVSHTMFCMFSVDNGLSPVWSESCEFDVINPSVALLRFVVQDMDMFDKKSIRSKVRSNKRNDK